MATLLAVDESRTSLIVAYPLEPILSLVAMEFMALGGKPAWEEVMDVLLGRMRTAQLECSGMKGE